MVVIRTTTLTGILPPPSAAAAALTATTPLTTTIGDRALTDRQTGQIADAVPVPIVPCVWHTTPSVAVGNLCLILLRRFLGLYRGE